MMKALLSRLPGRVAGAAVGAVVAGLVLSDSEAHALSVNVRVGGLDYEVSTFTGSYNENISKFETTINGGVMPWWNSQTDATAFASAVGDKLGLPNWTGVAGPLFAYDYVDYGSGGPPGVYPTDVESKTWRSGPPFEVQSRQDPTYTNVVIATWAQATLVPAAGSANVPGPLPALGLPVAFGFSRQLRKRIKASGSNPPSASTEA